MVVGLVSDSHGEPQRLRTALEVLAARGAEAIVHCGDICCTESVRLLGTSGIPTWLVAGNMDRHHLHELEAGSQRTAVVFQRNTAEVPLGNDEYLVATHGDNEDLLAALIRGRCFPYVCHGHTHRARDERIGEVRVICPGAITGPKHPAVPTVAILDTGSDTVEFHDMYHPGKPVPVGR